jgi:hypothetical protein
MIDPSKLLSGLPPSLRNPLIDSYKKIASNYVEHRWEPSELNGGKLCEVVYTIVEGAIAGHFSDKPHKPSNMVDACRALEGKPANPNRPGDRSLRILIPRMLPVLYEIRNNRGVGHVGGDVDPNLLDATAVYGMASWLVAELVRIFHGVSTEVAQSAVDVLVERKIPLIWEIEGVRRVLDPKMDVKDQVLLLLHQRPGWVSQEDLLRWVEYNKPSMFRVRVLSPLHDMRLLEYDGAGKRAHLSPLGTSAVESRILKTRPV